MRRMSATARFFVVINQTPIMARHNRVKLAFPVSFGVGPERVHAPCTRFPLTMAMTDA
jgi:hypothetical protein